MSDFADLQAEGIEVLEAVQDNPTFTWNGSDFICAADSDTRSRALEAGGFALDADLHLFVRVVHFGDGPRPEPKQKLQYRERNFRIEDVIRPAGESFLHLVCVDATRGA